MGRVSGGAPSLLNKVDGLTLAVYNACGTAVTQHPMSSLMLAASQVESAPISATWPWLV